jgi:hypothetical protein
MQRADAADSERRCPSGNSARTGSATRKVKAAKRGHQKIAGGNMTRPRAADDFAVIHARIRELRREKTSRPRAADDFVTIRARIAELRRERTAASAVAQQRPRLPIRDSESAV